MAKGERRCRSPNHRPGADDAVRAGRGVRFKCPRCKRWFCSICEGTDDGFKTCDACWLFIQRGRGRPATYRRMVKRYAFRIAWPELLAGAGGKDGG